MKMVPMVNKLDIWKLLREVFKVLMTKIIILLLCVVIDIDLLQ